MENRYELLSIFKEAVTNACKHSKCKHVFISISYTKNCLTTIIQDDGKGFEVDAVALGKGINEMRRRANLMKARIDIRSEINTGTTVTLEVEMR